MALVSSPYFRRAGHTPPLPYGRLEAPPIECFQSFASVSNPGAIFRILLNLASGVKTPEVEVPVAAGVKPRPSTAPKNLPSSSGRPSTPARFDLELPRLIGSGRSTWGGLAAGVRCLLSWWVLNVSVPKWSGQVSNQPRPTPSPRGLLPWSGCRGRWEISLRERL